MEELAKALYAWWKNDACAAARSIATDGLWLLEVPEGKASSGRYVLYSFTAINTENTNTTTIEHCLVTFTMFVTDEDGARTLITLRDALVAGYDNRVLDMNKDAQGNTPNMVRMIRQFTGNVTKDPDEGYMCAVDYEVIYGY